MRGTHLALNYESVSVKNKFVFREHPEGSERALRRASARFTWTRFFLSGWANR